MWHIVRAQILLWSLSLHLYNQNIYHTGCLSHMSKLQQCHIRHLSFPLFTHKLNEPEAPWREGEENTFHPHGRSLCQGQVSPSCRIGGQLFHIECHELPNCEIKGHSPHKTTLAFGTICKFECFCKPPSGSIICWRDSQKYHWKMI